MIGNGNEVRLSDMVDPQIFDLQMRLRNKVSDLAETPRGPDPVDGGWKPYQHRPAQEQIYATTEDGGLSTATSLKPRLIIEVLVAGKVDFTPAKLRTGEPNTAAVAMIRQRWN